MSPAAGRLRDEGRFLPGFVLAERYRVIGLLGRGGMGEVYRADDLKLGQPVALKFLPTSLAKDPSRLLRFFDEVRVARLVTHPNVCRVYDIGEYERQHFISMEYVDGEDLSSLLLRIGRLPEDKAVQIARQLCAGLNAAHEQGVLHRDLKPSNVMIDGRGRARITDFGLAGLAGMFEGGEVRAGTPAYMAPEQAAGRDVSVQSDIFSMGLVLYELFTGKYAFGSRTSDQISRRPLESTPTTPSSHVEGIDAGVERAILRCLSTDPAERPRSALAVAASLPGGDPLAAALAAGETPPPELVAEAERAEAVNPGKALAAAALALVIFGVATWLGGMNQLRAFVAVDKPSAAMVDRAREIVSKLGYTEPVFSRPRDSAFGYSVWAPALLAIERDDRGKDRWTKLRDRERGIYSFWYRQRPTRYSPSPGFDSFAGGRVERWNPFPQVTGEMTVSLDATGHLEFFACAPRRVRPDSMVLTERDWGSVFELAGLDVTDYTPVQPRYQRFMAPDERAAWVGPHPEFPDTLVRFEAGMSEGRLVLFHMLDRWEENMLIEELHNPRRPSAAFLILIPVVLVIIGAAAFAARSNTKRGRSDRRGAVRVTVFTFLATLTLETLQAHGLFTLSGLVEVFPILATGTFMAAFAWTFYTALEPYARRIWPSMLVSWSRLVSRPSVRTRDPLVGRSVLAGLLVGAGLSLIPLLGNAVRSLVEGIPAPPDIGNWAMLLGTRHALAEIMNTLTETVLISFIFAFTLVLARLITRRLVLAIPLALIVIVLLNPEGSFETSTAAVVRVTGNALVGLLLIGVLLRYGLLSLIVAYVTKDLAVLAATPDLSAWHGQPTFLIFAVVVAFAAYGYWAASGGKRLIQEEGVLEGRPSPA